MHKAIAEISQSLLSGPPDAERAWLRWLPRPRWSPRSPRLGIGWRLGLGLAAVTAVLLLGESLATRTARQALEAVRSMQTEHEPLANRANAVLEKLIAYDRAVGEYVQAHSADNKLSTITLAGDALEAAVAEYFSSALPRAVTAAATGLRQQLTRHIANARQLATRASQRLQWDARRQAALDDVYRRIVSAGGSGLAINGTQVVAERSLAELHTAINAMRGNLAPSAVIAQRGIRGFAGPRLALPGAAGLRGSRPAAPRERALRRRERAALAQPARGQRRAHGRRAAGAAAARARGTAAGRAARGHRGRGSRAYAPEHLVRGARSDAAGVGAARGEHQRAGAPADRGHAAARRRRPRGACPARRLGRDRRARRILQHHGRSHRARGSGAARPPDRARAARRRAHPPAPSPCAPRSADAAAQPPQPRRAARERALAHRQRAAPGAAVRRRRQLQVDQRHPRSQLRRPGAAAHRRAAARRHRPRRPPRTARGR